MNASPPPADIVQYRFTYLDVLIPDDASCGCWPAVDETVTYPAVVTDANVRLTGAAVVPVPTEKPRVAFPFGIARRKLPTTNTAHRLGYDRHAFWAWTVLAWVLLLVCYFLMPAPPAPTGNPNLPVNINYVYGLSDERDR